MEPDDGVEGSRYLSYMGVAVPGVDYAKLADMILTVEGQDLPCHSHILARESKMIFDLCSAEREGDVPAPKRQRLSNGDAASAPSHPDAATWVTASQGRLRLVEPFDGYTVAEVELLLTAAYDPSHAVTLVCQDVAAERWPELQQVLRLAGQLEAPRLAACIDGAVCSSYPAGCEDVAGWLPILALADRHPEQLQLSYDRGVRLAVAALSRSVGDSGKAAAPAQRYLAHPAAAKLSSATCNAVMQGFLSCTHTRLHAIRAGRPLSLAAIDQACLSCNAGTQQYSGTATFTWQWYPGFDVDDPRATKESASDQFLGLGLRWQVFAYLNGFQPENKGWLSLYLRAVPSTLDGRPARQATYRFTVKGSPDVAWQGSALVAENGAGFPRMMPTADLFDPEKGYSIDGTITVHVELSKLSNFDL
ncbi:hypothetical protein N2152v2_002329 [Parachlorella kessleri]